MKYVVGARGSQLSVAQTNWVIGELKKANPIAEYEIKTIMLELLIQRQLSFINYFKN